MIIIGLILSIFFILVIVLLCRTYTKDIFELENRMLQLEKRVSECEKLKGKDGEKEMACKKGKGGRRK